MSEFRHLGRSSKRRVQFSLAGLLIAMAGFAMAVAGWESFFQPGDFLNKNLTFSYDEKPPHDTDDLAYYRICDESRARVLVFGPSSELATQVSLKHKNAGGFNLFLSGRRVYPSPDLTIILMRNSKRLDIQVEFKTARRYMSNDFMHCLDSDWFLFNVVGEKLFDFYPELRSKFQIAR